ncbi:alkaline phosphatase [Flavobacterium alvei]|uniref:Alkaline phosphatase n=1 Tax=Flavobacterium alvei TaxID=2080416 RepID=A0A2S5AFR5_9FLAO|nr:VTT domain-containing protein [Flavobacterium alvei]POY41400.1 alkaline phosphatase [Flavobacterium alvei]HQE33852.1 VTT domain-containing protein [Flavobacterium alvei]HQF48046.1 VTT domain-containing protein [Flavobacterium alvei]HQK38743.1 VTT domain-containing protein [Flavobacterium alvei]
MNNFDWTQLINPEFYILMEFGGVKMGLLVILFIIFAETGLFAGFFLPGDSLLFLAGIYSELLTRQIAVGNEFANVVLLSALVSAAGVFGNMVGYWFGVKGGTYLYNKEDTFWFKEKYLLQSRDFFDKYGGKAIIFARFLPIFRTFAPIVAGIAAMDKKKFMFNNILGSVLWSFSMIFAGHYLSAMFLDKFGIDLKKHIEYIVIGIVLVTTLPVLWKLFKKRVHIE